MLLLNFDAKIQIRAGTGWQKTGSGSLSFEYLSQGGLRAFLKEKQARSGFMLSDFDKIKTTLNMHIYMII